MIIMSWILLRNTPSHDSARKDHADRAVRSSPAAGQQIRAERAPRQGFHRCAMLRESQPRDGTAVVPDVQDVVIAARRQLLAVR